MSKQDQRQIRDDIDSSMPGRRADDGLAFPPDTSWEAILERIAARDATPEEAAEFWREHEPYMLPPDDEP
jgi:hypothetical protein